MVADRDVLGATRIGERHVHGDPRQVRRRERAVRPELRGTFTVLADGGMDDAEIIEWLFTPDPTLPVEGAPIDALPCRPQDRGPSPRHGARLLRPG